MVMEKEKTVLLPVVWCSACLGGERVAWDGDHRRQAHPALRRWHAHGCLRFFCPECAGGLSVPRPPAEIVAGSGEDVLDGRARVVTRSGEDVTHAFLAGARRALQAARQVDARMAVFKARSPSCGVGEIHAGRFDGRLRTGDGVTAALFRRNGIVVFTERELEKAWSHWLRLREGKT